MAAAIDEGTRDFIRDHRVARLATADGSGRPVVVPVCYVFDGDSIYSPIDEKPKAVAGPRLGRVRNIEANPQVALVIDDYFEDWGKLIYVLISGRAALITPAARPDEHSRAVALLREKYPQYRRMAIDSRLIIKVTPDRIKRWDAGG